MMNPQTKNNLIYLGVAGAVVVILACYILYTDAVLGRILEIPGPILWGILSTPSVTAVILERFWEYRRHRRLWMILAIVAAVNATVA